MNSQILLSSIVHIRFIPFKHKLKYKVPSIYLNIDDLGKINKQYTFFSLNNFNLFITIFTDFPNNFFLATYTQRRIP